MMRPKLTSIVLLIAFVGTSFWLALVMISPYLVEPGTLLDLSGTVGKHENDALFDGLDPLPHAIYWIGDGECHQIAERSYSLNGNQMPFCARDLGLFAGLAAGFGFVAFFELVLNPLFAVLGLVPIGIDGGLQLVTSYESSNPLRLITGVVAGITLAVIIAQFVYVVQKDREKQRRGGPGKTR